MQMPRVIAKADNLDERNKEFEQRPLETNLFLNSVPKSGSHLLKNIMRMFVPVEQHYTADFIQYGNLKQHYQALVANPPRMSWGHLLFADSSAGLLKNARHILLIRDPYDWVLARARFFLSDNFQGGLDDLKGGKVDIEDFLNMMIFGVHERFPNLAEIYLHNAVAWMGTSAKIIRYEDLVEHVTDLGSKKSQAFFEDLFGFATIDMPDDWRDRVRIGSDRKQSGTARENLDLGTVDIPKELPEMQKKLVDYTAPGLRELLGY
jgi:hypothetical protein